VECELAPLTPPSPRVPGRGARRSYFRLILQYSLDNELRHGLLRYRYRAHHVEAGDLDEDCQVVAQLCGVRVDYAESADRSPGEAAQAGLTRIRLPERSRPPRAKQRSLGRKAIEIACHGTASIISGRH
jgi:hypothetical protein